MTQERVDITSPVLMPHYHERSIGPKVAFARGLDIFESRDWVEDGPGVTWPQFFAPSLGAVASVTERLDKGIRRLGPLALPWLIFKAWRLRRAIRRSERGEQ